MHNFQSFLILLWHSSPAHRGVKWARPLGPKAMSAYSKDLSAIIEPALEESAVEGSFDVYKLVCELTVDFSTRLVAGLPVESAVARETIRTE